MKNTKTTVYEIAEKAGVSIATVSRAMNKETRHKVSAKALEKIDKLARQYHYTPSMAAKYLTKRSYETIGVLFPHHEGILQSDYYSQIISGVADELLGSNHQLKMVLLKPRKEGWDAYDFQHGEGIDGLILTYWRTFFKKPDIFEKLKVPSVIINNVEKNIHARFVAGDHYEGGKLAARHLYEYGHRKIVVFSGKHKSPDAENREKGFLSFLNKKGIKLGSSSIINVNFESEKAYTATEKILRKKPSTTAIFCMNDSLAFGVLKKLRELKISCPTKVSVMGYDNDQYSEYSAPALTTIQVPVYELARAATKDLIQYIKEKKSLDFYKPSLFSLKLIKRDSISNLQ